MMRYKLSLNISHFLHITLSRLIFIEDRNLDRFTIEVKGYTSDRI